ncbi:MAG: MobA/MobL family protein [Candidatus Competibacteraceae bacterium]|nr:MobA/MobL family protein [Candidatus Competibacteraceae bacterium]
MAIYHCNHSHIGKTTQSQPGTAGAHIRYITRQSAEATLVAEHIPTQRNAARAWLDRHEAVSRKNARVCDKIEVALPRELNEEQRATLVRDFCQQLGDQQTPFFAAIHQRGADQHNPHAHIVLVDKSVEHGKRVLQTTERGSTDKIRALWEHTCNAHLELNGHEQRIDRRTLQEQGIEQTPQIHVGPRAQFIDATLNKPTSQIRTDHRGREIRYPDIDQGRTRREFNEHIIDRNLHRLEQSPNLRISETARLTRNQREEKRALNESVIRQARGTRSTYLSRREQLYQAFRNQQKDLIADREQQIETRQSEIRDAYKPQWKALYQQQAREVNTAQAVMQYNSPANLAEELKQAVRSGDKPNQGRLSHLFKTADTTHQLPEQHHRQRRALGRAQRAEQRQARDEIKAAFRPLLAELRMDWELQRDAAKLADRQARRKITKAEQSLEKKHEQERLKLDAALERTFAPRPANDRHQQRDFGRVRERSLGPKPGGMG